MQTEAELPTVQKGNGLSARTTDTDSAVLFEVMQGKGGGIRQMTSGSKVVCIDDTFPEWIGKFYNQLPKKGTVYTVRDMCPGHNWRMEPEIAITLVELINPCSAKGPERGFNIERFADLEDSLADVVKRAQAKDCDVHIELTPRPKELETA